MFEAIARGEIKGFVVIAPTRRCRADADRRPREFEKARAVRDLGKLCVPTTPSMPARMCCCRRSLGREIGNGDQFGTGISRQRAFLTPPGEFKTGLVDRQRSGKTTGLRRGIRFRSVAMCFGNTPPVGVRE